jgi:uncharacterized protein (TIGR01777 family)
MLNKLYFAVRKAMKVAITGATGLIGSKLEKAMTSDGAQILTLSRRVRTASDTTGAIFWDPVNGELDSAALEGCDAIVHLAGETISNRWTGAQKERIRRSRVEGSRLLVDGLKTLTKPPTVFVAASAIGFYGDRGDEAIDESSPHGTGFLPDVCRSWEAETTRAQEVGARTLLLRFGIVLSTKGGALAKMLLPFKVGLGGPMGSGRQWMSWIHIDDVIAIIRFVMNRDDLSGPINTTAPQPVRQAEFAKTLGKALRRPAIAPAPGFAVRLLLGEMGQALLLEGQKVLPRRLQEAGYTFQHPELSEALEDILTHKK